MSKINTSEDVNVKVTYYNEEVANRPYICAADGKEIIKAIKDYKNDLVESGQTDLIDDEQVKAKLAAQLIGAHSRLSLLRFAQGRLSRKHYIDEIRGYEECIPKMVEEYLI